MADRVQYDGLVLGGVFVSPLVGVGLGALTDLPKAPTLPALAIVAVAFVGHGRFVNGPVDRPADLADEVTLLE